MWVYIISSFLDGDESIQSELCGQLLFQIPVPVQQPDGGPGGQWGWNQTMDLADLLTVWLL